MRGRGLDLRADRATVDVEVGLRHDRPLPGRVAVPGHPDPGVQDRLAGVGQHAGDLVLRVLDEIVRQAAAQLHDGLRQCGLLVRPAHAPTLLRNVPARAGAVRALARGPRARSPTGGRAAAARSRSRGQDPGVHHLQFTAREVRRFRPARLHGAGGRRPVRRTR